MGYTIGRRLTKEKLQEIALQFNTRREFQEKDCSAYQTARRAGLLDEICSHMVIGKYSTPQLICKKIMEGVLGIDCLYNDRKTIAPYELDIYFPKYKLAIEYNGKGWHAKEKTIKRDKIKSEMCKKKNILLIVLVENSRNYEDDIKSQLIFNLPKINKICNLEIDEKNILDFNVDDIYEDMLCEKKIEEMTGKCKNIAEFSSKYSNEYGKIIKAGRIDLLEHLRERRPKWEDEEIYEKCSKISSLKDLIENHNSLYSAAKKRGIFEKATRHMERKSRLKISNKTDEELILLCRDLNSCSQIENRLERNLRKRNLYIPATAHIKRELYWKCWKLKPIEELLEIYKNTEERGCLHLVPEFVKFFEEENLI